VTDAPAKATTVREGNGVPLPDETEAEGREGWMDERFALLLLNVVAVLWGSQHAVIRHLIENGLPANGVNLLRFGLAAAVVAPALPKLDSRLGRETWSAGVELAVWMFLGYAFQAIGLVSTTASRSGFLLYLNVKLVPIFAWIFLGRKISVETWISAGMAFFGTVLLAVSSSSAESGAAVGANVGDLWSIAAAIASAGFILRLENRMQKVVGGQQIGASAVNASSLLATTVFCGGWVAGDQVVHHSTDWGTVMQQWSSWGPEILYLGLVTTALSNWIQALGQKFVSAQKAAIVYAMDPVYGAGFAYLLLGERLGIQGAIGASLITIAALINQKAD